MVLASVESNVSTGAQFRPGAAGSLENLDRGFGGTERRIAQAVGYMRGCLNRSLQVPALARMANISPSHFFAVFKRQTGFAPLDFFIRLRMQRACEFLEFTSLSVKEVAAELGYDDPFYFSRVFKTVSGIAPTEYRRLPELARRECRSRVWLGTEAAAAN